jgi:arylsulfatase A-like enzyme
MKQLAIAGLILVAAAALADERSRPNIVIIFTDDQGYADLGVQGIVDDIKTPHLDALCRDGTRFTNGYVTAPQCSPSRAGLLTGRYQQRFGYGDISRGPLPLRETTIAQRLKKAGYTTGMVGKWHLHATPSHRAFIERNRNRLIKEPGKPWAFPDEVQLPYMPERRGFDEYYCGSRTDKPRRINIHPGGKPVDAAGEWITPGGDRTLAQNAAALEFIRRRKKGEPFFLYLAYSIPHVPLEAPSEYVARFPPSASSGQAGKMPERRRYALSMMAAMDDGVGDIVSLLKQRGEYHDTLFFFASDNGAPLKLTMPDAPPVGTGGPSWDGSLNKPLNGEKGMLAEGGIRVPFFATWPKRIPAGKTYDAPASALDISATTIAASGQAVPGEFDGVDLLPFLDGSSKDRPHDFLYWRFWNQAAVRSGDWKLIMAGNRIEFLFNLADDPGEKSNLVRHHPDKVKHLKAMLEAWAAQLRPVGPPKRHLNGPESRWFSHYFDPE